MITVDDLQRLLVDGGDVVGPDGRKIGGVGQLFLDAVSGEPAWVSVRTGPFGTGESFVPLTGAVLRDDVLHVAYDRGRVKHAPRIEDAGGALSPDDERVLRRHYGLLHDDPQDGDGLDPDPADPDDAARRTAEDDLAPSAGDGADGPEVLPPPIRPIGTPAIPPGLPPVDASDDPADPPPAAAPPEDAGSPSGAQPPPSTDVPADDGMVLHAEQARVIGTERVPTERVRLRRYTVTEERTITVPVTREEFRVEYEPSGGGEPLAGAGEAEPDVPPDPTHRPHRHAAGEPDDR